jgi:uridylate kinase
MKKSSTPIILSIGGSIIIPKTGFDIAFLKKFRALILSEVKKGKKFILVIGGGSTCRTYQGALKSAVKTTDLDLDWMGIHTTIFNAQFVRLLFKGYADETIALKPTEKIKSKFPIMVAAGWRPGCSTDTDAVLLAQTYGAKELINVSNIEYAYDKDPNIYPDAKKIETMGWAQFRKEVVGMTWTPGKNTPFDPIASAKAQKIGLRVTIMNGLNLLELKKAINGKKVKGSVIS